MEQSHREARTRFLSSFSQTNVSDTRRLLRDKILKTQNFLHFMKDAYNSLSPALQLPNEIWIEIGWIVFRSCEETWLPEEPNGLLQRFLPLTHISQRLRLAFHSTPSCWTRLDLESPVARLAIQLSGNLSISAAYNRGLFQGIQPVWSDDESEQMLGYPDDVLPMRSFVASTMLKAKECAEDILIVSNHRGMEDCIRRWEGHSFPQLLHLTLQIVEWSDAYQNRDNPIISLRNTSLSSLRLHGIYPHFHPSCYSTLRHLTLSSYSGRTLMRMERLYDLLLQCKSLEELCLLNVADMVLPSSQTDHMRMPFNSLQSLTVAVIKKHVMEHIIQLIQAPILQYLYLHIEPRDTDHPRLLEDLVLASLPVYHSIRQTENLTIHYEDGVATFSALPTLPVSETHTPTKNPNISFKVELLRSFSVESPFLFGTLASFMGTNPVCEVLVVELNQYGNDQLEDTVEDWSMVLFPALPNLRKLTVSMQSDQPQSLENVIRALTPEHTTTALCPNLEQVVLSLKAGSVYGPKVVAGLSWEEIQLVRDMAKSRHNAHAPLSTLRFDTNELRGQPTIERLTKNLKEVVQNVEVDYSDKPDTMSFTDDLVDSPTVTDSESE